MMLSCSFAADLWQEVLKPLNIDFAPPVHYSELFSIWKCMYPGGSPQNLHIKQAWLTIPKIIFWHIWLEGDHRIFNGKKSGFRIIWTKIKSHLKECLGDQLDRADLSDQDDVWGDALGLQFTEKVNPPHILKYWQIRLNDAELADLCKKKARKTPFFDGAAKGNLAAPEQGVLLKM